MTLNILRVRMVQGSHLLVALVVLLATMYGITYFIYEYLWYLSFFTLICGAIIASYLVTMALTIHDVEYPRDHIFALFVMTEEERQGFFRYAKKHPEYRKKFGIYRLIGYKLKEML